MVKKEYISIYTIAKQLRQRMTPAEKIIWNCVKNGSFGVKFRRQEGFCFGGYRYVADFYCHDKNLIIEIDGNVHNEIEIKEYDEFREDVFISQGYRVIRFSNEEVLGDLQMVITRIKELLDQ